MNAPRFPILRYTVRLPNALWTSLHEQGVFNRATPDARRLFFTAVKLKTTFGYTRVMTGNFIDVNEVLQHLQYLVEQIDNAPWDAPYSHEDRPRRTITAQQFGVGRYKLNHVARQAPKAVRDTVRRAAPTDPQETTCSNGSVVPPTSPTSSPLPSPRAAYPR